MPKRLTLEIPKALTPEDMTDMPQMPAGVALRSTVKLKDGVKEPVLVSRIINTDNAAIFQANGDSAPADPIVELDGGMVRQGPLTYIPHENWREPKK